jgi:hypothetical protein
MPSRRLRLRTLGLSAQAGGVVVLAGCGFQLRQAGDYAFKTLFANFSATSPLGVELRRNLPAAQPQVVMQAAAPAMAAPVLPAAAAPSAAPPAAPAVRSDLVEITAPMVATFYRSPAPGEPSFVELGARINAGQTDLVGLLAAIPEGHRVTVGDGNHHAQQRLGAHRGGNKQRQQQARCGKRAQHLPGLGGVRAERRSKDQS